MQLNFRLLNKKIINNGIWLYLLQIFNTIVPLLTLPYITRILGASKYGVFTIALNIIGYYQVVVEYGFGMSATRKIALSNRNQKEINYTFTTVLYSRVVLLIICMLFTMVYLLFNIDNILECKCLLVLFVSLFGYCIQQNWLFQGMQDMKYISLVNILARTVSVVLIFSFVKSKNDLVLYCFLYSISSFFSGFLGLILAWKKYHICLIKVFIRDIMHELKIGWYVFTTSLSSKIFGAIGITLMGLFASDKEVGIYSAIQKIPNIMMFAWIPISQVLYPVSSKMMQGSFSEGKQFVYKLRRMILPIFIIGSFTTSILSESIVKIAFGNEYSIFHYWVIPLLAWLIVSIDNNFNGIQILLGSGHDKQYSKCFQVGMICTVLFNIILIYFYGGNGASLAPLLSELVLWILLRIEIKKISN